MSRHVLKLVGWLVRLDSFHAGVHAPRQQSAEPCEASASHRSMGEANNLAVFWPESACVKKPIHRGPFDPSFDGSPSVA